MNIEKLLKGTGLIISFSLFLIATLFHILGHGNVACVAFTIIFSEIGAVLLTIVILHYAHENYLREQEVRKHIEVFKMILRTELESPDLIEKIIELIKRENKLLHKLAIVGIKGIKQKLPNGSLRELLINAKEIKVLKTFFPEHLVLEQGLTKALENNAKIELFLLNPSSSMLVYRSRSLNTDDNYGKTKVIKALEIMGKNLGEGKVVLFDSFPGNPLIMIDKSLFLGLYLIGFVSPDSPWFEIDEKSELYNKLLGQFTIIENQPSSLVFKDSKSIDKFIESIKSNNIS